MQEVSKDQVLQVCHTGNLALKLILKSQVHIFQPHKMEMLFAGGKEVHSL